MTHLPQNREFLIPASDDTLLDRIERESDREPAPGYEKSGKPDLHAGLDSSALDSLTRKVSSIVNKTASILLFHQISDEPARHDFHPLLGLKVNPDRFEEQMEYLSATHICLDLDTAVRLIRRGVLPPRSAVVTFDDGYYDGLSLALPILEKYKVPATIYITVGFVEGSARVWWHELEGLVAANNILNFEWDDKNYLFKIESDKQKAEAFQKLSRLTMSLPYDEQRHLLKIMSQNSATTFRETYRFLNWDEVKYLDNHPLITIGAHTINHLALGEMEAVRSQEEIVRSKEVLESKLRHTVDHFAYPFGGMRDVSPRDVHLVKAAGFQSACMTHFDHVSNAHSSFCHALPRITIDNYDTLSSVRRKLFGVDAFIYKYLKRHRGPVTSDWQTEERFHS